jgi:hypothetical protein
MPRIKGSKNKKVKEEYVEFSEPELILTKMIVPAEPSKKMNCSKKELPPNTAKQPRVTITEFDDKGRMISTTFLCDANSLHISRDENITYTPNGKSKRTLWINIESNVLEIE